MVVKKRIKTIPIMILTTCMFLHPILEQPKNVFATDIGDVTNDLTDGDNAYDDTYDETYQGDDTYTGDDGASQDTKKPNDINGSPFEETPSLTKYVEWENAVIVDKIETNISVTKDNKYNVSKKMRVFYNTDTGHNVTMTVPLNNFLTSSSDVVDDINVVSNVSNTAYKTSISNNDYKIRIDDGNEGRMFVDYTISYTYISRGDEVNDYDAFKQDLVGVYDAPVCSMSYSITMPYEYERQNLYFQDYNGDNIMNVIQSQSNLTMSGYYNSTLDNGSISIVLLVQNRYFDSTSSSEILKFILGFVSFLCTLLVIFGFALTAYSYYKFGINPKVDIRLKSKPLKNVSSVDAIAILRGGITNKDLLLYMIELANLGYIKIEDSTYKHQKNRRPEKSYKFIKIKNYDGDDAGMREFMSIIFNKSDIVTAEDLSDKSYKRLNRLRLRIQDVGMKDLWNTNDKKRTLCSNVGMIIPLLVSLMLSLYNIDVGLGLNTFSFLYGPVLTILIYMIVIHVNKMINTRNIMRGGVADIMTWLYVISFSLVAIVITGVLNAKMFVAHSFTMTMAYLVEILLLYCSCNMRKRTERGIKLCGDILGFRQFLTEVSDLEMKKFVLRDEQYIYHILPMAIALDIASVGWQLKMDENHISNPDWYESTSESDFSIADFMMDWEKITDMILRQPNDE